MCIHKQIVKKIKANEKAIKGEPESEEADECCKNVKYIPADAKGGKEERKLECPNTLASPVHEED